MQIVGLICSLLRHAYSEWREKLWEDQTGSQHQELPPIRYDDDPTDIYLA